MRVAVILNGSAGALAPKKPELDPERLGAFLRAAGMYPTFHYSDPAKLAETARRAVTEGADAVVAGGGDGTISTVAGALAGSATPLGLLPLGTLNHFAKDLRIPSDAEQAIAVVGRRHLRSVDVGEVNGRVFINNCSIGAYPEAVRRRDQLREHRGHGKWRAMTIAWIDVLRHLRRLRTEFDLDGQIAQRRTPLALVSNNRYKTQLFSRNLRDRLDGGQLWLYTTRVHRFFPMLRLAFLALLGRLDEADEFESWSARRLTISTKGGRIEAGIDGEVVTFDLPLRFQIRPKALRVFAPPDEEPAA